MSKYSKSLIIKEAEQIKAYIEKNRKIPKTCNLGGAILSPYSVSYLMSKLIVENFKKSDIGLVDVIVYNGTKNSDTINEKVLKDDYLNMCDRFITFCQKNRRVPSYVTTRKSKIKVSFELFLYGLAKIIVFHQENKYLPNYCTFTKGFSSNTGTTTKTVKKETKKSTSSKTKTTNCVNPYVSKPHYTETGCNKLGQCTPYYCGPHSIHQAIRKFGITKYSEKQIASWCGTTTKGSDHNGINTAIAKISKESGIKLTVQWKNFSDLGKTTNERFEALAKLICKPNVAVLTHIAYAYEGKSPITKNTPSSKIFGHYEVIDKCNVKTHFIRALNSLGTKKGDGSYQGHLQDRSYETQRSYFANTPGGQKALCIITK